jgi:hypothetical protein
MKKPDIMDRKTTTKVTVFIDKCHFQDEYITDEKKIARLIKNHLAHLGNTKVYYEKRYENISSFQKLMRSLSGL